MEFVEPPGPSRVRECGFRMTSDRRIGVSSITFSKNEFLRARLLQSFPKSFFNATGERLTETQMADFLGRADALLVGMEPVGAQLLGRCPDLRIVAKYGVGLDNIDTDACRRHGVAIGWTGGVNRLSVAEETLGFMLALSRNLYVTSNALKTGAWMKDGGTLLTGKTVGIVGVGFAGKELVRLIEPFHCRILVNDIIPQAGYYMAHGLIEVSKEVLFRESDILTIHTPLTSETRHMIDRQTLSTMKPSAFLINTSRGQVVNQADLKDALRTGRIAGAAIDVYEEEPPDDLSFLSLPNLIATPHIAGNAAEAVNAMGMSAIGHLEKFYGVTP